MTVTGEKHPKIGNMGELGFFKVRNMLRGRKQGIRTELRHLTVLAEIASILLFA